MTIDLAPLLGASGIGDRFKFLHIRPPRRRARNHTEQLLWSCVKSSTSSYHMVLRQESTNNDNCEDQQSQRANHNEKNLHPSRFLFRRRRTIRAYFANISSPSSAASTSFARMSPNISLTNSGSRIVFCSFILEPEDVSVSPTHRRS